MTKIVGKDLEGREVKVEINLTDAMTGGDNVEVRYDTGADGIYNDADYILNAWDAPVSATYYGSVKKGNETLPGHLYDKGQAKLLQRELVGIRNQAAAHGVTYQSDALVQQLEGIMRSSYSVASGYGRTPTRS